MIYIASQNPKKPYIHIFPNFSLLQPKPKNAIYKFVLQDEKSLYIYEKKTKKSRL